MILPTTYLSTLLLVLISMLCLGSWANTQKKVGKWRYEFYFYDFALGALVLAAIAAFTFGTLDPAELTFQDNYLIATYRKMAWAVAAGFVVNLAMMMMGAGISVAGMSVAIPLTLGTAMVINGIWHFLLNPTPNPILLFGGLLLVIAAISFNALAYAAALKARLLTEQASAPAAPAPAPTPVKASQPASRSGRNFSHQAATRVRTPSAIRGIVFSVLGGVFLSAFYPMVDNFSAGDGSVGPYGAMLLLATGVLISTFVYNPFFMNFPIQGLPVGIGEFFRSERRQHLMGIAGGAIWSAGILALLVASTALPQKSPGLPLRFAISQGPILLGILWGLLVWREFNGAPAKSKSFLTMMLALFVIGTALAAIAPMYPIIK